MKWISNPSLRNCKDFYCFSVGCTKLKILWSQGTSYLLFFLHLPNFMFAENCKSLDKEKHFVVKSIERLSISKICEAFYLWSIQFILFVKQSRPKIFCQLAPNHKVQLVKVIYLMIFKWQVLYHKIVSCKLFKILVQYSSNRVTSSRNWKAMLFSNRIRCHLVTKIRNSFCSSKCQAIFLKEFYSHLFIINFTEKFWNILAPVC